MFKPSFRFQRSVFRGVYGEIFALFQACVGNFHTIRPREVVGTIYLDSSYVTFKYFAFLSVCHKFELLGHVQAAMMIWALFLPFFLDSLLVTVSGFIVLFWSSSYFNLSSLHILGSTPVGFPAMSGWKCLGIEYRSDDVIKVKFVKLWDLLRYSERTTSKTPTRQKLAIRAKLSLRY